MHEIILIKFHQNGANAPRGWDADSRAEAAVRQQIAGAVRHGSALMLRARPDGGRPVVEALRQQNNKLAKKLRNSRSKS